MGQVLHLESFDDAEQSAPQSHPEYVRGHQEGVASANASNALRQTELREEIVTAFSEAQFTFSEARQSLLSELRPVLDAISECILPPMVTAGLTAVVSDILLNALSDAMPKHPTIVVHPDHFDAFSALLSEQVSIQADLQTDPTITSNAAWLSTATGESTVDFKNVVEAVEAALCSFTPNNHRKIRNG